MSRLRPSETLKALKERHSALCQELQSQVETRRALLIKDGLLNAMCESLSLIQLTIACGYSGPRHDQPGLAGSAEHNSSSPPPQQQQASRPLHQQSDVTGEDHHKFDELLRSEVQLLQLLTTKSELGNSQQTLAQLLQPDEGTISPCVTGPCLQLQRAN
jgi:hypothetical protein